MKNFGLFIISLLTVSLFFACGGSTAETQKEDVLRDEVFTIHDEVMPRMSEIVKLKGDLKEMPVDSTREMEVKATISQLEKAEEGMMDWMSKFTQPEKLRESKSHEEIMAYLEAEKVTISQVRDAMNGSIESAQRMLQASAQ